MKTENIMIMFLTGFLIVAVLLGAFFISDAYKTGRHEGHYWGIADSRRVSSCVDEKEAPISVCVDKYLNQHN